MTGETQTAAAVDRSGNKAGSAAQERQAWMSALAKAAPAEIAGKLAALQNLPRYAVIRPAESGSVMVRGRAGGTGSPFNLGEMSVTRCVVQLTEGTETAVVGHAYVAGRDKAHAESAALLDALLQTEEWRETVKSTVIAPLVRRAEQSRQERREKVAATKVNFFTVVRGEN